MNERKQRRKNRVTVIASDEANDNMTEADWAWVDEATREILDFLESKEAKQE